MVGGGAQAHAFFYAIPIIDITDFVLFVFGVTQKLITVDAINVYQILL